MAGINGLFLNGKEVKDASFNGKKFYEKDSWENPYVTDGLIAMFDGEWNAGGGKHTADNIIKNLVGDQTITVNSQTENSFTITNRNISVDIGEIYPNCTMEIKFKTYSWSDQRSLTPGVLYNSMGIQRFIDYWSLPAKNGYYYEFKDVKNKSCQVTFSNGIPTKAFYNREQYIGSHYYKFTPWTSSNLVFQTNPKSSMEIQSVRLYNRILTDKELNHNSKVDYDRYGMKPEISYVQDGLVAWFDSEWNVGLNQHDDNARYWTNLVDGTQKALPNGLVWSYDINNVPCLSNATTGTLVANLLSKNDLVKWNLIQNPSNRNIYYNDYTCDMTGAGNCTFSLINVYSEPFSKCEIIYGTPWGIPRIYAQMLGTAYYGYANNALTSSVDSYLQRWSITTSYSWNSTLSSQSYTDYVDKPTGNCPRTTTSTSSTRSLFDTYYGYKNAGFKINKTHRVFALRVYNRKLTYSEVIQNQESDMWRFNLKMG